MWMWLSQVPGGQRNFGVLGLGSGGCVRMGMRGASFRFLGRAKTEERSVERDLGSLGDLAPLGDLARDHGGELLRRVAHRVDAVALQALHELG